MDTAELKLEIFRQVDSLEHAQLEEFYGLMLNYLHSNFKPYYLAMLTESERAGIEEAITEIENGRGISHVNLVAELISKYGK